MVLPLVSLDESDEELGIMATLVNDLGEEGATEADSAYAFGACSIGAGTVDEIVDTAVPLLGPDSAGRFGKTGYRCRCW